MTYRFARFSVNADTRQLLGDEGEVHVSPKAFALLMVLIEERARAVSKAELQDRLWPSTFIGDTSLATLVAEVRRALGDSAHESRYVRTVHRFGYCFVADVTELSPASPGVQRGVRMYLQAGDRQFLLPEGVTVIGRGTDAGIRLDSGGVSRYHARITVSPDDARVEDLGSKNGTFVRGQRIAGPWRLADGDEIRLGHRDVHRRRRHRGDRDDEGYDRQALT